MRINTNITELTKAMESLDARQGLFLAKQVLALPTACIDTGAALKIAIYDWLSSLNLLNDQDKQTFLNEFGRHLTQFANKTENAEESLPIGTLAILDGRFLAFRTGETAAMYDLSGYEFIDQLPHPALTCVSCDLGVLLMRLHARLQELRHAGQPAQPSGSASKPVAQ